MIAWTSTVFRDQIGVACQQGVGVVDAAVEFAADRAHIKLGSAVADNQLGILTDQIGKKPAAEII